MTAPITAFPTRCRHGRQPWRNRASKENIRVVMPGLVPGIHVSLQRAGSWMADTPGHDGKSLMNDLADPVTTKPKPVRARDAASLILLRGKGRDLELLAGRRPLSVRFMPGVYVFPGGAVDAEDRLPWQSEVDADSLP